jgi:hypothetical protein
MKISRKMREAIAALERDGKLEASWLFTAAKAKDHPCHKCFEWNEKRAATKYNLLVAQSLIRAVRITFNVVDRGAPRPVTVPFYVRDTEVKNGYQVIQQLEKRSLEAIELVQAEIAQAIGSLKRALSLGITLQIAGPIEEGIASIVHLEQMVAAIAEQQKREAQAAGGKRRGRRSVGDEARPSA